MWEKSIFSYNNFFGLKQLNAVAIHILQLWSVIALSSDSVQKSNCYQEVLMSNREYK